MTPTGLRLFLLLCALWSPSLWGQAPPAPEEATEQGEAASPFIKGMGLSLHSKERGYAYPLLDELPALGVTHVLVFVHLYQEGGHARGPARDPLRTPNDTTVLRVLRRARGLGLEASLCPIVLISNPSPKEWRGNLLPPDRQGRTPDEEGFQGPYWEGWFKAYSRELRHYARLAQEGGASWLSVGSELSSTEGCRGQWRRLIASVRRTFAGDLTYSANWDHYQGVTFWEDLDAIGLSAYYELCQEDDPSLSTLRTEWEQVRQRLLTWRQASGLEQPFLFTEVGYASQDGCARAPWDYTGSGRRDLGEQRDCYQAFVDTWRGAPELQGVFFYEWWGEGGAWDRGYTPRGKPALEVLRRYFGASER